MASFFDCASVGLLLVVQICDLVNYYLEQIACEKGEIFSYFFKGVLSSYNWLWCRVLSVCWETSHCNSFLS